MTYYRHTLHQLTPKTKEIKENARIQQNPENQEQDLKASFQYKNSVRSA